MQCNKPHEMHFDNMQVESRPGGSIRGQGADSVGQFTIEGSFSPHEPKCRFVKQYTGKHAIYYEGDVDTASGVIRGHWGFKAGENQEGFELRPA